MYDDPVDPYKANFQQLMDVDIYRRSLLLNALLKREDISRKFLMILSDLSANIITADNVSEAIEKHYSESYEEIGFALRARKYSHWTGRGFIAANHANMIEFAERRGEYILGVVADYIGFESRDKFRINVTGGDAIIGTQRGTTAQYYSWLTVPVRPDLPKFTVFDHWLVNGERVNDFEIHVGAENAPDGVVDIRLITREEFPPLVFSDAYASSLRSGCILTNFTDQTIHTSGLFLSNDIDNLFLWELPDAAVRPGGALALASRNGAGSNDLLSIRMGFNVRSGRVLFLSDETGKILDYITVP
jgi:hypothetical protein